MSVTNSRIQQNNKNGMSKWEGWMGSSNSILSSQL